MDALRGMIGKAGKKSQDNNESSSASSAHHSSGGSGEPDFGTNDTRDNWNDLRQNDSNTSSSYSSRAGGGSGYSSGSSGTAAMGLGSEQSLSRDSGRDKSHYSTMNEEESGSYPGPGRRHNSEKYSHRSDNDDSRDRSSYVSGATRANADNEEASSMGGGHSTRGMYGRSS